MIRKMKKEMLLFAFIAFVLVGCFGCTSSSSKESTSTDTSHTGTKGITLSFVSNQPPSTVFDKNTLDVVVQLANEGAVDASGYIYLGGYDSSIFPFDYESGQQFSLEGKTKYNTLGGRDYKTFSTGSNVISLPSITDSLPQTLQASACYNYETDASIAVCIDPNPNSALDNEACTASNPTVSGGQGAPLAVTAVKQYSAPGKTTFLITITNEGSGQVVDRDSIGYCPNNLGFNNVDLVDYSVSMSGSNMADCKPTEPLRLANKQTTLQCTFTLSSSTAPSYQSVLEVKLYYGYLTQITKTITVKSTS